MTVLTNPRTSPSPRPPLIYVGIILFGGMIWIVSTFFPAQVPAWGPYEFSWPIWLTTSLSAFWFARGLHRSLPEDRLGIWRQMMFWTGLVILYGITQTGFEYLAQRMFFTNRLQHVGMHHLGPFLLALSGAGGTLYRGAPNWAKQLCDSRITFIAMRIVQQPAIAFALFVGLFWFWLIPPIHFVAMLDPVLYQVMNWSMVVDGILFWALVLDRRSSPPAFIGFGLRAALAIAVMFPQIILGALISFATTDLFPYYAFCGRYYSSISAIADQQIGGIIIWIPPAMMSVLGLLIVVDNMRRAEEQG